MRREEIGPLVRKYLDYWKMKVDGAPERVAYSRDKVATDLALMERAAALGKLVALYFDLDGALVAANFAALRDRDRVDDYLCLRDAGPELAQRGLGIYAVLRNMESLPRRGVRRYDLSAWITDYKRKFLNAEALLLRLGRGTALAGGKGAARNQRRAKHGRRRHQGSDRPRGRAAARAPLRPGLARLVRHRRPARLRRRLPAAHRGRHGRSRRTPLSSRTRRGPSRSCRTSASTPTCSGRGLGRRAARRGPASATPRSS